MKSDPVTVEGVFKDRRQYRVPFFQRHYVWSEETQWKPLWEDVSAKAEERRSEQLPVPHFLGAIVLDPQPRPGLRGVEIINIIDGQQRLTTLQFLISALAIIAREKKAKAKQADDGALVKGSILSRSSLPPASATTILTRCSMWMWKNTRSIQPSSTAHRSSWP